MNDIDDAHGIVSLGLLFFGHGASSS